ncbi:MAG: gliding motility-associated C-terminal domain-containing protein [Flavobacteriales bacterium]|nr:gliding motility-associated C-terminal domain-containing protein [Flavobacteriales bacterium]
MVTIRSVSLLFVGWFLVHGLQAQYWAKGVGGPSNDSFTDLVVDASGNSYVTGEFGGVITFGTTSTMTTYGSLDAVVAKFDPSGGLIWSTHFGGPGLDRGVALELGPNGELVVVGQFMLAANFGGTTLTSQNNTQDVFVVSMNASTGTVNWVRQGGGGEGVDQPNGVSIGPDGSVAVAGEFRGTATFDGGTLTSVIDPDTEEPSVDIFLQIYAGDGTAGWLKHGAAEFADRAMDVEHDDAGNIYLTGQFSDTITFDGVHNNAMYSAVFLMRYSPAGVEEWFRVFGGGTYNQVFDLLLVEGNRLFLVGDLQGTVIFQDNQPDIFSATAPRSSFLLDVTLDGELTQHHTWGSANEISTRAVAVSDDEVVVYGRFACQLTDFSALYGTGTFLATGQHDLYIARFNLNNFVYKEAQQFGGAGDKGVGGIAYDMADELQFCGAFDELLVLPSDGEMQVEPSVWDFMSNYALSDYCGDPNYSDQAGLESRGLKDAFITKGYVNGRQPYDFFFRDGTDCDRSMLGVVLRGVNGYSGMVGPDTLEICGQENLLAWTRTSYAAWVMEPNYSGPEFSFLWQDGSISSSLSVETTGWYSVQASSQAGCLTSIDSLYVIVNPLPARPLISDDQGVNVEASQTVTIIRCLPIQPWLWATGVDPADQVSWNGPDSIPNDSIQALTSGYYTATVITPEGCSRSNTVQVILQPNGTLPPLEAQYDLWFPEDTDQNDTVTVCPYQNVSVYGDVTFLLDGDAVDLPFGIRMYQRCGGNWSYTNGDVSCTVPGGSGASWRYVTVEVLLTNAPCGTDSLFFTRTDSIYVIPITVQPPVVSLTGPTILCPGDTATLVATCVGCDSTVHYYSGLVSLLPNGALVNGPGTSSYTGFTENDGCFAHSTVYHTIDSYPRPTLGNFPDDAIICPNSTAIVYSDTPGQSYQWYGPLGPIPEQNDSIFTSQPGEYYLEMVDLLGCEVVSDPILITDYATPYLNVLPDGVLCEDNETAELQVVTTGSASLVWASPLSGNSTVQVVSQPGTYSCSVTACSIVTTVSTIIYGSVANANLMDPGPYEMCEGSSLVLQAVGGQAFYLWEPEQVVGPTLTVNAAGTYTLLVSDFYGCTDTLAVQVGLIPVEVPLTTNAPPVCFGAELLFGATGAGTITWYADAEATQVIGTGTSLSLGIPALGPHVVFVQQDAGACLSDIQTVIGQVNAVPAVPMITAPDSTCVGEAVSIFVADEVGTTFTWNTPNGAQSGSAIVLDPVVLSHAGTYSVLASIGMCTATGASHTLIVHSPIPFSLGADTSFCVGASYLLVVPDGYTDPLWSTGSTADSIVVQDEGMYTLYAQDENGCITSAQIGLTLRHCDVLPPNIITPNGDGVNDTWQVVSGEFASGSLEIFNRYGDLVWSADPKRKAFAGDHGTTGEPLATGVYYFVLQLDRGTSEPEVQKGYLQILR